MEVLDIDWKNIDSRFVRDEFYEDIRAPKWLDFLALDEPVDDDAWFCKPDCNHPRIAASLLDAPLFESRKVKQPGSIRSTSAATRNLKKSSRTNRNKHVSKAGKYLPDVENDNPNPPCTLSVVSSMGKNPKSSAPSKVGKSPKLQGSKNVSISTAKVSKQYIAAKDSQSPLSMEKRGVAKQANGSLSASSNTTTITASARSEKKGTKKQIVNHLRAATSLLDVSLFESPKVKQPRSVRSTSVATRNLMKSSPTDRNKHASRTDKYLPNVDNDNPNPPCTVSVVSSKGKNPKSSTLSKVGKSPKLQGLKNVSSSRAKVSKQYIAAKDSQSPLSMEKRGVAKQANGSLSASSNTTTITASARSEKKGTKKQIVNHPRAATSLLDAPVFESPKVKQPTSVWSTSVATRNLMKSSSTDRNEHASRTDAYLPNAENDNPNPPHSVSVVSSMANNPKSCTPSNVGKSPKLQSSKNVSISPAKVSKQYIAAKDSQYMEKRRVAKQAVSNLSTSSNTTPVIAPASIEKKGTKNQIQNHPKTAAGLLDAPLSEFSKVKKPRSVKSTSVASVSTTRPLGERTASTLNCKKTGGGLSSSVTSLYKSKAKENVSKDLKKPSPADRNKHASRTCKYLPDAENDNPNHPRSVFAVSIMGRSPNSSAPSNVGKSPKLQDSKKVSIGPAKVSKQYIAAKDCQSPLSMEKRRVIAKQAIGNLSTPSNTTPVTAPTSHDKKGTKKKVIYNATTPLKTPESSEKKGVRSPTRIIKRTSNRSPTSDNQSSSLKSDSASLKSDSAIKGTLSEGNLFSKTPRKDFLMHPSDFCSEVKKPALYGSQKDSAKQSNMTFQHDSNPGTEEGKQDQDDKTNYLYDFSYERSSLSGSKDQQVMKNSIIDDLDKCSKSGPMEIGGLQLRNNKKDAAKSCPKSVVKKDNLSSKQPKLNEEDFSSQTENMVQSCLPSPQQDFRSSQTSSSSCEGRKSTTPMQPFQFRTSERVTVRKYRKLQRSPSCADNVVTFHNQSCICQMCFGY